MPAALQYLAQLCIDDLDRIGRIDHFADRRGKRKERNHLAPGPSPRRGYRGEFGAPRACLKGGQRGFSRFRTDGLIDRLERSGQRFALFPVRVIETVPDQVHDASLQRRGRAYF